ncbi:MAG TPA: hypothetical protein VFH11_14220 [Gemmatimonadota bacterium]|nr:hypothetical protein [Gemmatimonadota bacterium]
MEFAPLLHSSAFLALAGVAGAILVVYAVAARRRFAGAGLVLRLLSIAALVIPAWTLFDWYQDLARARDIAARMSIQAEPIVERAAVNGAALVCLGFLVMVCGIWLARRVS